MLKISRLLATLVAMGIALLTLLDLLLATQMSYVLLQWASIVVTVALVFGVVNLLYRHAKRVQKLQSGWSYSAVLVISFMVTLFVGRLGPNDIGLQQVFSYVLYPLESTFFALIALFIASAAFRAFRVKDFETFLLVAFAIIVLLGQVPIGYQLWSDFPLVKEWVLRVPTLAGIRGIMLGVALGTIATGLRILLGADQPYIETEGGQ
ncbi:MAG: hypothetical protein AAF629_02195 [Chloroflexota bacterium]